MYEICFHFYLLSKVKSLTLEATPLETHCFQRSYKISHNPGLKASWDALPSFARSSQSNEIGLSILKPPKMVKSRPIFDQASKLGKASRNTYNPGLELIL